MPIVYPEVKNNDIIEFTLVQELDNQMILNVLHYIVTDATASPNIKDVTDQVTAAMRDEDGFLGSLWKLQSTDLKFKGLRGQVVSPTRTAYWLTKAIEDDGPKLTGKALPSQDTGVIVKRTAKIGPSHKGDFFIAGMRAQDQSNGIWTDATLVDLAIFADKFTDTLSPDNVEMEGIIYHGKGANNDDPIMAAYHKDVVHTMQRRVVGHGK